jgi:hypothetical protein
MFKDLCLILIFSIVGDSPSILGGSGQPGGTMMAGVCRPTLESLPPSYSSKPWYSIVTILEIHVDL